jgi:two-component system response regulator RegX3
VTLRILLLEDDPDQLAVAEVWLREGGHAVSAFSRGEEAIRAVEREGFDLAVLDWMVPDVSGEEVLRWLRGRGNGMPVVFATARDEEEEVAHILELGADDYVVKPLRRREFLARIDAVARRAGKSRAASESTIVAGPYVVDLRGRSVTLHGSEVRMTPRMVDVAILLFRKRGELVSRAQLYRDVWGHREQLDTRTVDTHVSRLRTALALDGRHGWRLSSVYQHGYRLEETPGTDAVSR